MKIIGSCKKERKYKLHGSIHYKENIQKVFIVDCFQTGLVNFHQDGEESVKNFFGVVEI
jgi:hypothetical protein